jgi:hypothetical protein
MNNKNLFLIFYNITSIKINQNSHKVKREININRNILQLFNSDNIMFLLFGQE